MKTLATMPARSFTVLAPISALWISGEVRFAEELHHGEGAEVAGPQPVCDAGRMTWRPTSFGSSACRQSSMPRT